MYGIGGDFSFLCGRRVLVSRKLAFQTQILLEGGVEISIEGEWKLDSSPLSGRVTDGEIVGSVVVDAVVENDRTLALHLSIGATLRMFDSKEHFESFTISAPGKFIVV